ncbi:MAG: enoyl-CoA hydratase/isomerase family protein [Gaiella sp.]
MSGSVGLEVRSGAAWITLDRPDKLNALDAAMVAALAERLRQAAQDDAVKVVVLRGAGRAFSAGYDLSEGGGSEPRSADDWHEELTRDVELTLQLWALPKPTIAAVHGWCLGGALDLAIACDMVVAAESARFGVPEIRYGSGPVTLLLPFVIGQKKANELLFTGDDVDADTAARIGLVNEVVPVDELEAAVERLVARIAPTPLPVLRLNKMALTRAYEAMGLRTAQQANLDLGAILNALDTPEQRAFDTIAAEQGLKAALAWRAEAYRQGDA